MNVISRILVALGIILVTIAFNLSVSTDGSDIINLNMVSQRQNLLMIGCVVFIAGIILVASSLRNREDVPDSLFAKPKTKSVLIGVAKLAGDGIHQLWRRYFVGLSQGWSSLVVRVFLFLVAGDILRGAVFFTVFEMGFGSGFASSLADVSTTLLFVYAFRRIALATVSRHIVGANILTSSAGCILLAINGDSPAVWVPLLLLAEIGIFVALFMFERSAKNKGSRH